MVDNLLVHDLLLIVLLWLGGILYKRWARNRAATCPTPRKPATLLHKHSQDSKPFPGLTHKPPCALCEQVPELAAPPPRVPPAMLPSSAGRPRQVDTSAQFCPQPQCAYYGWVGRGNLRANGYPNGGRWRQLQCLGCKTYFLETHGTPLHGKRVAPEVLVWAVGAVAEGLGIRAVARVFAVDPTTVLHWLTEVADHAAAFSRYFLHDVHVTQVQLDELFALLSAVKAGEVSEGEALSRLSRSPHWVWVALDPVTKLVLAIEGGARTLAMAQCLVHQVAQVLAPDCVPLFLTDGFKEYLTGRADALWALGPTTARLGHRPAAQTSLAAAPPTSVCSGDQADSPAPAGGSEFARGVRHPGGDQAGAGRPRLADQHGFHRARQPHYSPACGRRRPAGDDPVQRRGGVTPATGPVSPVLQFLFAACQLTPAFTTACTDQRDGLSETLAPVYTGDGRGVD